jgi:hypothetical protein
MRSTPRLDAASAAGSLISSISLIIFCLTRGSANRCGNAMTLVTLNLRERRSEPPHRVRRFLREADRRIERFQRDTPIHGFVPSDYERTYGVLQALAESALAPGDRFCEWGSGFGVVACLAAMIGFDACGIEVEGELVDAARRLAADFEVPVEFVRGSFIPPGGEAFLGADRNFAWLTASGEDTELELGMGTGDFDTVFAYPWPDEERALANLFGRYAAAGAVLVTYHGGDDFLLRRKPTSMGRRPSPYSRS